MTDQALEMPDFDLATFGGDGSIAQDDEVTKQLLAALNGNEVETVVSLTGELKAREKVALQYDELQHIQLTFLQHKLLSCISDGKLQDAPLRDVVSAFKVLKDKQLVANGKPTEIHGLVGYLEVLEREETSALAKKNSGEEQNQHNIVDITPTRNDASEDDSKQLNLFDETVVVPLAGTISTPSMSTHKDAT